jgi:NADPH-dependent 2,4-dienoyl-CoA reductase/sulfur reductase-like enzyme/two-component sensor histidine kinase/rhodanese-related sulfurtransferase
MDATEGKTGIFDESGLRLLSHQLKSPLNSIQSLLAAVAEGYAGATDPKVLQLVSRAAERVEEARRLVSDILEYESAATTPSERKAEVDIPALVRSVASSFERVAAEKEISLHISTPTDLIAFINADARRLELAVGNLVENAIKYTPAQGKVVVSFEYGADKSFCTVAVSDTGGGVAEADLPRIFDPFFRSPAHKFNTSGTGLGLSIAKRIVEGCGGEISVRTRVGEGSTFTVTLPNVRVEYGESRAQRRRRIVIIGGVTAGTKTAARLRRLDESLDITIVEKSDFLSYTGCGLPAYIGGAVASPKALMSTADNTIRNVRFFQEIKNIRTLSSTLAVSLDRTAKVVKCRDCTKGHDFSLPYDTLVLATGAVPKIPPVPGIDLEGIHFLHGIEDAEKIKRALSGTRAQDVCIIGGGLIGISAAEALVSASARVTILEVETALLPNYFDAGMSGLIAAELARKGVKVFTGTGVREIRRRGTQLEIDAGSRSFSAELVILSTGVTPNASLARDSGLAIGEWGGVTVDEQLRASDPDIFAVGDCAESTNLVTGTHEYWPLGSISTKMGRIAADVIAGRKASFEGSLGTALFRIFEMGAARTGLTLAAALSAEIDAESVLVSGLDRDHYVEGAKPVFLTVIADRGSGRLLGAQGCGRGEIVSRVQLLASAIARRLTLDEFFALDLGYNPCFNGVIDMAQTACLVLQNKIEGRLKTVTASELREKLPSVRIVDVSPLSEYSIGSISGSVNVPLESIRREGIPFAASEDIVLASTTSAGAYEAYRILASRGYSTIAVLEGGLWGWQE